MQCRTFRIEQTLTGGRADARGGKPHANDARDLAAVQGILAAHRRELAALIGDGEERQLLRAAGELGAAVDDMNKAAQSILQSAENIDDRARAYASVAADDRWPHAQAIQDNVVRIYEACNFQDLAGQRIGNAIALLCTIEERITAMLEGRGEEAGSPSRAPAKAQRSTLINGPRLDGDGGHASQADIDKLFA